MSLISSACPSHFLLDQWVLGELEPDARDAVGAHVDSCARCQQRMDARRADEAAFVLDLATLRALQTPADNAGTAHPEQENATKAPGGGQDEVRAPIAASSHNIARWRSRARVLAVGGALAAGLAVTVVQGGSGDALGGAGVTSSAMRAVTTTAGPTPSTTGGVRTKGRVRSALFVQDVPGVRELASSIDAPDRGPTALVHPGDTLQVAVTSSSETFAAVISRDGAGVVSTYVAATDGGLVHVAAGRNVPLPRSTVLDHVVGRETIAVFLCEQPGLRADQLDALVVAGTAPAGCVVERHVFEKREAP